MSEFSALLSRGRSCPRAKSFGALRVRLAWGAIRHATLRHEHDDPCDREIAKAWCDAWAQYVSPLVPWPGEAKDIANALGGIIGYPIAMSWAESLDALAVEHWEGQHAEEANH